MLATTRIHKFVNHDGSSENILKNNFTLSIAVGSSDTTAQAKIAMGAERIIKTASVFPGKLPGLGPFFVRA